jgi:hypothetical protein
MHATVDYDAVSDVDGIVEAEASFAVVVVVLLPLLLLFIESLPLCCRRRRSNAR